MIDPGSIADWLQAMLLAGLVGGVGALFVKALREEEVSATATAGRRPAEPAPLSVPSERPGDPVRPRAHRNAA
jgi:hypothetical protein